ncbi:MAG: hypothetical protein PHR16_15555 [Methylovulum sp.]|nr:hypothetical protein [Methylovulum sp.]
MSNTLLSFSAYQAPPLPDGCYQIGVTQTVTLNGAGTTTASYGYGASFKVAGPRFALQASDIQAVFPADGSTDVRRDILPHIVLTRSTLPWERKADNDLAPGALPWLAILLFAEDEAPTAQIAEVDALATMTSPWFPQLAGISDDRDADRATVIDVSRQTLQQLLPASTELPFLAHVRDTRSSDNGEALQLSSALVTANRIPQNAGRYQAFLISIEERYDSAGFDYQNAAQDDLIRLICLKQWSFETTESAQDFADVLAALNRDHAGLQLPPNHQNAMADAQLNAGYAAIPHHLREAQQTASWYRGPLAPGPTQSQLPLPATSSDALVFYDQESGLFDESYAAAWELGRLLALQSQQFASSLYRFKQAYAQRENQRLQLPSYAYLPLRGRCATARTELAEGVLEAPVDIIDWLQSKALLRGIPFRYLVADTRMLPPESIRFFQVDSLWVECLLDGAFAIGNVSNHIPQRPVSAHSTLSGFILRSAVVASWPDRIIEAIGQPAAGQGQQTLPLLRQDQLSGNVLIGIFAGTVQQLVLSPRPQMLHFGFAPDLSGTSEGLIKPLRDQDGAPLTSNGEQVTITIPFKSQSLGGVVDVTVLAGSMAEELGQITVTSADFAFQLIEGAVGVSFNQAPAGAAA